MSRLLPLYIFFNNRCIYFYTIKSTYRSFGQNYPWSRGGYHATSWFANDARKGPEGMK